MTPRERRIWKYKRMLEERRGYNFAYWSEKFDKMLLNGWSILELKSSGVQWGMTFKKESTGSVEYAKR